jgi:AcrR family transcriptional regulator
VGDERGYHHGDLRRELMAAAVTLMTQTGDLQLSMREVARQAGVSSGAPFHHFPNKEALLAAVATEGFEGLDQAIAGAATATTSERRFRQRVLTYLQFASAHAAHYRTMFAPAIADPQAFPEAMAAAGAAFGHLVGAVGDVTPSTAPDDRLLKAIATWAMAHGFVTLWLNGLVQPLTGDMPEERVFETMAALAQRMVQEPVAD